MKELHGPDNPFPVDVTAYDCAAVQAKIPYRFGLNTARAIATLRLLADQLESKLCLLQGVESRQKACVDDYTMSSFTVSYAQKKEAKDVEPLSLNAPSAESVAEKT